MEKEDTIESIVDELPVLLVRQAYKKLKSGDDLLHLRYYAWKFVRPTVQKILSARQTTF